MTSGSPHSGSISSDEPQILIIIPTYNECENIRSLSEELLACDARFNILIVDDNSPDGTGSIADALVNECPGRVAVLHRSTKEGLGRAYIAGFKHALATTSEFIAQMDADHSHRPEDLVRLVDASQNADLVLGSRYIDGGGTVGWPWHRKAVSRLGSLYAGVILGVPIRDFTGGFKVWRRATLQSLELESIRSDGYSFQIETTYRALHIGARVKQVPIIFTDRVAGKSKLSRRVMFEAALVTWQLRLRHLFNRSW